MAAGEVVKATSGVQRWTPPAAGPVGYSELPFDAKGLDFLDDVISGAEMATGLRFSAYIGDLGEDSTASARDLLAGLGTDAAMAVLVAISPGQRLVEVVTGSLAARRVSDRAARLAVLSVVSSAAAGDLLGALANAIRTLADQAGTLPERATW